MMKLVGRCDVHCHQLNEWFLFIGSAKVWKINIDPKADCVFISVIFRFWKQWPPCCFVLFIFFFTDGGGTLTNRTGGETCQAALVPISFWSKSRRIPKKKADERRINKNSQLSILKSLRCSETGEQRHPQNGGGRRRRRRAGVDGEGNCLRQEDNRQQKTADVLW